MINNSIDVEAVRSSGSKSMLCSSCNEKLPATARCLDCMEFLCYACHSAHNRVRMTKDHQVFLFEHNRVRMTKDHQVFLFEHNRVRMTKDHQVILFENFNFLACRYDYIIPGKFLCGDFICRGNTLASTPQWDLTWFLHYTKLGNVRKS